jgi:peroxiredoxin
MSYRTIAALAAAVAILLLTAAGITPAFAEDTDKTSSLIGDTAPDFTLKDLTDKDVKLSDAGKGKVTLLTFWVTWCPHCQREMPVLQSVHTDLGGKDFTVVAVGLDEPADVKSFCSTNKLTYPVLIGGNKDGEAVADVYGVTGVPAMFFIGKDGKVKSMISGESDEKTLRSELEKLGIKKN